jgi:hypothetical protein
MIPWWCGMRSESGQNIEHILEHRLPSEAWLRLVLVRVGDWKGHGTWQCMETSFRAWRRLFPADFGWKIRVSFYFLTRSNNVLGGNSSFNTMIRSSLASLRKKNILCRNWVDAGCSSHSPPFDLWKSECPYVHVHVWPYDHFFHSTRIRLMIMQ